VAIIKITTVISIRLKAASPRPRRDFGEIMSKIVKSVVETRSLK